MRVTRNAIFLAAGVLLTLPLVIVFLLLLLAHTQFGSHDFTLHALAGDAALMFRSDHVSEVRPGSAAMVSFVRIILCIVISSIIGIPLGVGLSLVGRFRLLAMPTIDFIRALPITFLLQPVSLATGLIHTSVPCILACIPCSLLICVCIADRTTSIDAERLCVVSTFFGKRRRWPLIKHLYIFELFAGFMTGLRLAVPYSVILIGVLEFVGAGADQPGFGSIVARSYSDDRGHREMIIAVILYGVCGMLMVQLCNLLTRRLVSWQSEEIS